MPRDRTFENKVLDETSAFLENVFNQFKELVKSEKIHTKDYIGCLPSRKKLVRLKKVIESCLENIDFATQVAWSNKFRKKLEKEPPGAGSMPLASPRKIGLEEIKFYSRKRRDCY